MKSQEKTEEEIKIDHIFQSILGDYEGAVIDSVAYVELLIAFQNEFKMKFSTQEFVTLRDVKSIRENILTKILK